MGRKTSTNTVGTRSIFFSPTKMFRKIVLAVLVITSYFTMQAVKCNVDLLDGSSPFYGGTSECLGELDAFLPARCACDFPIVVRNMGGKHSRISCDKDPIIHQKKKSLLKSGAAKNQMIIWVEGNDPCQSPAFDSVFKKTNVTSLMSYLITLWGGQQCSHCQSGLSSWDYSLGCSIL
jgi:hypothetical protein